MGINRDLDYKPNSVVRPITEGIARRVVSKPGGGKKPPGNPNKDPFWSDVIALLNFDSGPPIVDQADAPASWTLGAASSISALQAKFGASSLLVANGGAAVSTPYSSRFDFSVGGGRNGCFTMEGFSRHTSLATNQAYLSTYVNSAVGYTIQVVAGKLTFYATGDGVDCQGTSNLPTGSWFHWCVERSVEGGPIALSVNGIVEATSAYSGVVNTTGAFLIGQFPGFTNNNMIGNLDSIRITKNRGRYGNANFTPPSRAFPTSA